MSFFFNAKPKRIYLDYAGATPVSPRAEKELARVLSLYGNPSAIHKEGVLASNELDKARAMCATVLNAHAYEIYFVGTGTESCNLAVLGTVESRKSKVESNTNTLPHVVTSVIEHPAVLEPIRDLEKKGLITVTYIPVSEDGVVRVSAVADAITENTVLISIMYANNEIGTIQPVKEIGRAIEEWKKDHGRAHSEYPYYHIDACQAGNFLSLDCVRLKCHLMSVNSSKVYGPKGVALLYVKEGIHIVPTLQGGGQERKLRSGTEAVALASSFAVALQESQEMKEKESARLLELNNFFRKELEHAIPNVQFYGIFDDVSRKWKVESGKLDLDTISDTDLKTENLKLKTLLRLPNNINFRVPGMQSEEMILRLDAKGFAVSHKSACASQEDDGSYVIQALGATHEEAKENIRVTMGRNTTRSDLVRFVAALKDIREKFGAQVTGH